jgi:hypothetical protein
MPKSRLRKNHKQKVDTRNKKIKENKARVEKMQREYIMNLIKQEQEKGLFENNTLLNPQDGPVIDGPVIDGPMITGPVIDGPMITGPVIDGPILDTVSNDLIEESSISEESDSAE